MKTYVVDFGNINGSSRYSNYEIMLPPGAQDNVIRDTTPHEEKCIDDYVDIVQTQHIVVEDGNIGAYIKTAPIKEIAGVEKPKGWRRIFPGKKTTESVFGVKFGSLETRVDETKTEEGTVYEIFINLKNASIDRLKEYGKSAYSRIDPNKVNERPDSSRKERRTIAAFLKPLTEIYAKLGIGKDIEQEVTLMFNTYNFKNRKETRFAPEYVDRHFDTDFYRSEGRRETPEEKLEKEEKRRAAAKKQKPKAGRKTPAASRKAKHELKDSLKKAKETERGLGNGSSVAFDDVVGLEDAKIMLKRAVKYFKDPEAYEKRRGVGMRTGIIFYGPSGTGKSLVSEAFANEAEVKFVKYKAKDILDAEAKYQGQTENNFANFMAELDSYGQCVCFVDEADQLLRSRELSAKSALGIEGRLVNMMLDRMQGVEDAEEKESRGKVFFMFATNRIDDIDSAILSRTEQVEVKMPDYEQRKVLIERAVKKHRKKVDESPFALDLDYDAISKACEGRGYSGRDLVFEGRSIFRNLVDDYFDADDEGKNPAKMTTQDWIKKIEEGKEMKGHMGFSAQR